MTRVLLIPNRGMILVLLFWAGAAASVSGEAADDREGLLLEYRFEGNLTDTSPGAHPGKMHGNPVYAPGRMGQCLVFDGKETYLDSGTNLPSLSATFTIECWVKPAPTQAPYADIYGNHAHDCTGFALQQDGHQTNRYYFTYGTGKAWVYSKTVTLTPSEWQHVAVVKTPDRLRVYLNGILAAGTPVDQPMAVSPTGFMIGLGIAGQARCFNGAIDELRVWDRPRTFKSSLPQAEQVAQFVKTVPVERSSSARWNLFPREGRKDITFSVDPENVPASIDAIVFMFDCRDARSTKVPFASPMSLLRSNGFRATVAIPGTPGYYRLTYQPSITVNGGAVNMPPGEISYMVLGPDVAGSSMPAAGRTATTRPKDAVIPSTVVSLNGEWLLAIDPKNVGREQTWWAGPVPDAKRTIVPWIIQDAFPGYHGVAWYWRDFTAPVHPHTQGRYLLRFEAVDYKADVWLNGQSVGGHEGGETPFVLDVTDSIKVGGVNRLAVRVLNPTHEPIDGMTLNQTPHRAKVIPYRAGASYNHGGIVGAVELAAVPAVFIDDLYLRTDSKSGLIRVQANVRRAAGGDIKAGIEFSVAPAASGQTLDVVSMVRDLPPGNSLIEGDLHVHDPQLWNLNDPHLYRVTARIMTGKSCDERSARCGFRDFRFDNGHFRLNGRRVFLRSSHTVNAAPIGQQIPHDPDLFRRDLFYMKTMGFNCIRFIWGGATREQLDLCDEIGLMVYEESAASNPMEDSPHMPERFDRSVAEMIRRDRNHPSVVMWGLLNETPDGPYFRHATEMLPLVRSLDETRVVMLNSGRWDAQLDIGSLCNPGASGWDTYLGGEGPGQPPSRMSSPGGYCERVGDAHAYPRVPHTADTIRFLRSLGGNTRGVFLSEYGIGSAMDLWRVVRHFEQLSKENAEDAQYYRDKLNAFLADWERWRMADCFAGPEEFFAQSLRKMAGQRTLGLNAIRANPSLVGHSVTGMMDHVNCGEGLFTLFRELKPGTIDAMFDGLAPLRWCLFVEPVNVYRKTPVRLEAVLANEDALAPGEYPVRFQVVGPRDTRVFERTMTVKIPDRSTGEEPAFALPILAEDVVMDVPSGGYRFLATFERGAAATGGETSFFVADPRDMPPVDAEIVLWGQDDELGKWLIDHGIRVLPLNTTPSAGREVILASAAPPAPGGAEAFGELARRIARGSTAVFLSPQVFRKADQPTGWVPLKNKGTLTAIWGWLYLKDEWAKCHPIFDGLPSGGLMDYTFYREIIPDLVWTGQDPPDEAVAGAIKASQDYASGLLVSVYKLGAGRFVLNTLQIRENLGRHPAAEVLLRNLLRYAAGQTQKPPAELPADFDELMKAIGYR